VDALGCSIGLPSGRLTPLRAPSTGHHLARWAWLVRLVAGHQSGARVRVTGGQRLERTFLMGFLGRQMG